MLDEAKAAAGDMWDGTSPSMHHVRDLRGLVEPSGGEPCEWGEVLDAIGMVADRQRRKGKPIRSWTWVAPDALALRDRRLTALPAPNIVPLRVATGPPSWREEERQASAVFDEAARKIAEMSGA